MLKPVFPVSLLLLSSLFIHPAGSVRLHLSYLPQQPARYQDSNTYCWGCYLPPDKSPSRPYLYDGLTAYSTVFTEFELSQFRKQLRNTSSTFDAWVGAATADYFGYVIKENSSSAAHFRSGLPIEQYLKGWCFNNPPRCHQILLEHPETAPMAQQRARFFPTLHPAENATGPWRDLPHPLQLLGLDILRAMASQDLHHLLTSVRKALTHSQPSLFPILRGRSRILGQIFDILPPSLRHMARQWACQDRGLTFLHHWVYTQCLPRLLRDHPVLHRKVLRYLQRPHLFRHLPWRWPRPLADAWAESLRIPPGTPSSPLNTTHPNWLAPEGSCTSSPSLSLLRLRIPPRPQEVGPWSFWSSQGKVNASDLLRAVKASRSNSTPSVAFNFYPSPGELREWGDGGLWHPDQPRAQWTRGGVEDALLWTSLRVLLPREEIQFPPDPQNRRKRAVNSPDDILPIEIQEDGLPVPLNETQLLMNAEFRRQDLPGRVHPFVLQGYDCSWPTGLEQRRIPSEVDCNRPPLKDGASQQSSATMYLYRVPEWRPLRGGTSCRHFYSRRSFFCGVYDHVTPTWQFDFDEKIETPTPEECKSWAEHREYVDPATKTRHALTLGRNIIPIMTLGKTFHHKASHAGCNGGKYEYNGTEYDQILIKDIHVIELYAPELDYHSDGRVREIRRGYFRPLIGRFPQEAHSIQPDGTLYLWPAQGALSGCPAEHFQDYGFHSSVYKTGEDEYFIRSDDPPFILGTKLTPIPQEGEHPCLRVLLATDHPGIYVHRLSFEDPVGSPRMAYLGNPQGPGHIGPLGGDKIIHSHAHFPSQLSPVSIQAAMDESDLKLRHLAWRGKQDAIALINLAARATCLSNRERLLQALKPQDVDAGVVFTLGPGRFAEKTGETFSLYECKAVAVNPIAAPDCYEGLLVVARDPKSLNPIMRKEKYLYLEPNRRRLLRHLPMGDERACDSPYPYSYALMSPSPDTTPPRHICVHSNSIVVCEGPEEAPEYRPELVNDTFRRDSAYSHGIADLDDMAIWQRHVDSAMLNDATITRAMGVAGRLLVSKDGYSMTAWGNLLEKLDLGGIWPFMCTLGTILLHSTPAILVFAVLLHLHRHTVSLYTLKKSFQEYWNDPTRRGWHLGIYLYSQKLWRTMRYGFVGHAERMNHLKRKAAGEARLPSSARSQREYYEKLQGLFPQYQPKPAPGGTESPLLPPPPDLDLETDPFPSFQTILSPDHGAIGQLHTSGEPTPILKHREDATTTAGIHRPRRPSFQAPASNSPRQSIRPRLPSVPLSGGVRPRVGRSELRVGGPLGLPDEGQPVGGGLPPPVGGEEPGARPESRHSLQGPRGRTPSPDHRRAGGGVNLPLSPAEGGASHAPHQDSTPGEGRVRGSPPLATLQGHTPAGPPVETDGCPAPHFLDPPQSPCALERLRMLRRAHSTRDEAAGGKAAGHEIHPGGPRDGPRSEDDGRAGQSRGDSPTPGGRMGTPEHHVPALERPREASPDQAGEGKAPDADNRREALTRGAFRLFRQKDKMATGSPLDGRGGNTDRPTPPL